mmetsp:Transcript_105171/g.327895  ORF Transcript_105171/g.327895 Transcript_105171/m.327895 type:complete len:342 (+) Transcript_105171:47-1072(+)
MIDTITKTAQADLTFDDRRLQSPDDEARSGMGYPYSALPPSPLSAIPSPIKTLHGRHQSFTQRLSNAEALQEATHARLKANRTAINDAKEARLMEANAASKDNKRMMKEAGIGNIKAPDFAHSMSVKERLRKIDEAAHRNANRIRERREILELTIKEEEEKRRLDAATQETKRKSLVFSSPPSKRSWKEIQTERLRSLRPLEGVDVEERMATSMATLRELLPRCASDLSWAEKRLEEKRALQSSKSTGSLASGPAPPREPEGVTGGCASVGRGSPASGGAAAGRLPGIPTKSASAPSLLRETRSLAPKPGHTKLYPSMMERYRVIEGHARQNAAVIESLRH